MQGSEGDDLHKSHDHASVCIVNFLFCKMFKKSTTSLNIKKYIFLKPEKR